MTIAGTSTEDLIRSIETQLVEWRRLPVRHPQQIGQRNHVVKAFETLQARLLDCESQLKFYKETRSNIESLLFEVPANRDWDSLLSAIKTLKNNQDDVQVIRNKYNAVRKQRAWTLLMQSSFHQPKDPKK